MGLSSPDEDLPVVFLFLLSCLSFPFFFFFFTVTLSPSVPYTLLCLAEAKQIMKSQS